MIRLTIHKRTYVSNRCLSVVRQYWDKLFVSLFYISNMNSDKYYFNYEVKSDIIIYQLKNHKHNHNSSINSLISSIDQDTLFDFSVYYNDKYNDKYKVF